jgi:hypothetical protein
VVVEGTGRDAQQFGDRRHGASGVGQQVTGGLEKFGVDDGGAAADAAAGAGGRQALVGASDCSQSWM